MPTWERDVYSSMVQRIGYDSETEEMTVVWTNGKTSAYSGVPEGVAIDLSKAPSVGQMINSAIKGVYGHRYI